MGIILLPKPKILPSLLSKFWLTKAHPMEFVPKSKPSIVFFIVCKELSRTKNSKIRKLHTFVRNLFMFFERKFENACFFELYIVRLKHK